MDFKPFWVMGQKTALKIMVTRIMAIP